MHACQPQAQVAHKLAVGQLGGKGGHGLGLAIGNLEQHQGRVGAAEGALAPEQATPHDLDDVILVQVPQGRLTNGLHLISNGGRSRSRTKEGVTSTRAVHGFNVLVQRREVRYKRGQGGWWVRYQGMCGD